jgi:hypothetical protein
LRALQRHSVVGFVHYTVVQFGRNTNVAEVSGSRMVTSFVGFELSRVGETLPALLVHCACLNMCATESFLVQMDRLDVTLQSFLLSELFPTVLAAGLFLLFMHGNMSTQSCRSVEAFATLFVDSTPNVVHLVSTNIATVVVVLCFDMGF